ncbi:Bug family tripartite tricarboxylate transporter substrate binding protein [Mesorhizobium australicum]|uniref:Tripartite-type tricarboxylate transporter, receptor component TctC n=1 Tax=Mesorhizobium australicum TaxID=536018 RepID=A0A1X7PXS0_9HYPH|nr:tripartite tricarboxylate transporter substrate binding protein [Mesorhizobium australicum]SMH57009.1 Tripartite-type tricarboxylate transporter, receptor component TctC [Mesorhizobium australicum]
MKGLKLFFALVSLALTTGLARAEDWPTRPVTFVVPFAAGGITDTVARRMATVMTEKLGQPVVVENRPGAGGIVGTESVANAKADGYTIIYSSGGPMSILPQLQKGKLSYDPIKAFIHIRGVSSSSQMIVANPATPYNNITELVEYAKANPGKVTFGSPGIGTAQHLVGELLKSAAGIDMLHIPYKAGSAQMTDLMAGVIDLSFDYVSVVKPYVDSGKMKVIGTTAPERNVAYPDAQTVVEAGFPGGVNVASSWVSAPAGIDQAIVDKLSAVVEETMKDPGIVEFFKTTGLTIIGEKGPDVMTQFVIDENTKYGKVIEEAKIVAQ